MDDIVRSRTKIDGAPHATEPVQDILGNGNPGDGIRDSDTGYGLEYTRPEQTAKPPVYSRPEQPSAPGLSEALSAGGGAPGSAFRSDTGYGFAFDRPPQDRQNDSAPRGNVAAPAAPAPERLDRDEQPDDLEE